MKFIGETLDILGHTTWPSRKQRWTDFIAVLEYTIFFVIIIYLFDTLISNSLIRLLNIL